MNKVKCIVAYDGTNFFGYQVQPGKRTVQYELEDALKKLHKGRLVHVTASGRTDRGVHALGQVIHFQTDLSIPEDRWARALNSVLPEDIWIRQAEFVQEAFHARFNVTRKEYRYRLLTRPEPDLFRRFYTLHITQALDLRQMQIAAQSIIGTHDFSSFCAANTSVTDKTRTVYELAIDCRGDETIIRIVGSGFLYQMVRIITGTLLDVGLGNLQAERMAQIIAAHDRSQASKTAPPIGLTLWRVTY
ncbi:MAG: tRNA pseudouridine(38-40) synthase TruA [Sporolactobacillus sp.]